MAGTKLSSAPGSSNLIEALLAIVSTIPKSTQHAVPDPKARAESLAKIAALKAAGVSSLLAIPPGPLGLATVLPDLMAIWRLQSSLVADIAAIYGKTACLRRETMIYCLFKHGGAALMRDIVVRIGERYLVRRAAVTTVHQILRKVGVRASQRMIGKSISRLIPVAGAVGVGFYAYADTKRVGDNAITLFSKDVEIEAQA